MRDVEVINRYEILRELGRGRIAVVYLARQIDLDRLVALKAFVAFGESSAGERFLLHLSELDSLVHPNIVTVHDHFEHDGVPYIATEFLARGSLRPYVHRMTPAQIGGVLEGLLAGLAHAETHGIVHRDLKPENVMVTGDGRVRIADFGIAKVLMELEAGQLLTATGTTVGTPAYMAPEQAMAQDIGPWTDLYSVGCMAFELFTGNVPFHDSDTPMAILLRQVNDAIMPVRSVRPEVDQRISDWIERLLVKEPTQRTQNAQDAWDDFEEILLGLLGPSWRREARLVDALDRPAVEVPTQLASRLASAARRGVVPVTTVTVPPADFVVSEPRRGDVPVSTVTVPPAASEVYEASVLPMRVERPAPGRKPRVGRWTVAALALAGGVALGVELVRWLTGVLTTPPARDDAPVELVTCTLFAPPKATADDAILVQVFTHVPEEAAEAARIALSLDSAGRLRGYRTLELPVTPGNRLTYELRLPGCQIDSPVEAIIWRNCTEAVQFLVSVPNVDKPHAFFGTLLASVDGIPAGHLKFKLDVVPEGATRELLPAGHDARRYTSAFVSYASKDRAEVLRRVQMLSAMRIKFFQDVLHLQPGDRWERRIECGLDDCDLFLLFWSSAAKESAWVRREVQHVLERKGGVDGDGDPEIRPVMVEGPPIPAPWDELRSLHFNDHVLYVLDPEA